MSCTVLDNNKINVISSRRRQTNFSSNGSSLDESLKTPYSEKIVNYKINEESSIISPRQIKFYRCSPRSNVLIENPSYKDEISDIYMHNISSNKYYKLELDPS